MTTDLVHWAVERDGPVVVATFANPPMGYFCANAASELAGLIESWRDPAIRAIVITGTNGRFITHYSVEELISFGSDQAEMEQIGTALSDGYHALLGELAGLPKPVIAAIGGDCMGGGLELALWCDLRIVGSGDYRLGLPEIRIGIMPGGSGTQLLAGIIGTAKAREMVLLGTVVDPQEALRLGIVHQCVTDPLATARTIAHDIATLNPRAIANIKRAMAAVPSKGLAREAVSFLDTMRAPEALVTMRRYIETPQDARRAFIEHRQ